ncbi:MAG: RluA family pseudouridine synthase [Enterococcus sp.]
MEIKITVPNTQADTSVEELLKDIWLVPRKVRHFLRMRKAVSINQTVASFQEIVHGGDQVQLTFLDSDYSYQEIKMGNASLVAPIYEDEHLIIVNKPVGIKTHPNDATESDTLLNHLAAYLAPKDQKPYVVHRLDTETSGAVLFAKNPFVLPILNKMLEEKTIHRKYQAVVWGIFPQNKTFTEKIGRHRHDRRKRVVDPKNGQNAITHVSIDKKLSNKTQIYCTLDTGRTHQIRVHLSNSGHPIVGDPLYQTRSSSRMMLHAVELEMTHPFTHESIIAQAIPGLW